MRTTYALLAGGAVLLALAGLSLSQDNPSRSTPSQPAAPKQRTAAAPAAGTATNSAYPVVGYLEKRGQTITIRAGPQGPLYSIKTAEGKVLCENLSASQLRAQAPELAEFIKGAVAGNAGSTSDARVRVHADMGMR